MLVFHLFSVYLNLNKGETLIKNSKVFTYIIFYIQSMKNFPGFLLILAAYWIPSKASSSATTHNICIILWGTGYLIKDNCFRNITRLLILVAKFLSSTIKTKQFKYMTQRLSLQLEDMFWILR